MNKVASRPSVIPCRGGTTGSRLAVEVARELESQGSTGPALDLSGEQIGPDPHGPSVAIDGCASACASRQAAARGVRLVAAVNLAQLRSGGERAEPADPRELASRIAARLGRDADPAQIPPRPKRHGQSEQARDGRTHTVDDYLLAMDAATSPIVECGALVTDAPTLASHVSDELGVTRVSAGEMLRKLEAEGLVGRGTGKQLLLTPAGRARADALVRRQRLLEVFATRFLRYTPAECREAARTLRGAFDEVAIFRLERRLGFPERCPHGCPVDAARAREEAGVLRILSSLAPGERACVAWLRQNDAATLRILAERGVNPGVELRIAEATATGELWIEIGGHIEVLEERQTGAVLVRTLQSSA